MCLFPIHIKNSKKVRCSKDYAVNIVPCGKCVKCLKKRANQWFLRLKYELKEATSAYFVTLTYENRFLNQTKNGYMTTRKQDLQDYLKRLRKRESKLVLNKQTGKYKRVYNDAISYYACSEYGKKGAFFMRPHYHLIIFNVSDVRNLSRAWSVNGQYIGNPDIKDICDERLRYVTGYIEKKVGIGDDPNDDREKEFSLMSKGLGLYYTKVAKLHHTNTLNGYTKLGKHIFTIPRYYRNKMFPDEKTVFQQGEIKFTITTKNIINQKIAEKNYENFLISEARRIKDFGSLQNWHANSDGLTTIYNRSLKQVFTNRTKKLTYENQKSVLQPA